MDDIAAQVNAGGHAKTKLRTDERVLARITDGIYRQPASALRELIFNAYDADAENVWIQTDAPRFSQITITDDGIGMTLPVLEHLVHHIGGSPKRTQIGVVLGVTDEHNPKFSHSGRKLIGKIGIGLFSVAQLTRHFQVITKVKGGTYRHIADIRLKTFSEDQLETITIDKKKEFETGDVEIWREPAADIDSHGTQIVLLDLKDYSKSLLQSRERWTRAANIDTSVDELVRPPPEYHIGSVDPRTQSVRKDSAKLPWDEREDVPEVKFRKLYQAVLDQVEVSNSDPTLDSTFDNYLSMLWTLGLSSPVEYVDQHPYLLTGSDNVRFFLLSNENGKPAKELFLKPAETLQEAAGLSIQKDSLPFSVTIDGVKLFRPIRFRNLPTKSKAKLNKPMLFVAKCKPNLKQFPADSTGGQELDFEGYFFWATKVIPKDNNGVMLRIGNASGTLFDDTFMKYEVSEQTRLRQISAELFFSAGLDAALNIDRESFNYSHPHVQFVTKWVHRALRQLATRHKAIGSELNAKERDQAAGEAFKRLEDVVVDSLSLVSDAEEDTPIEVHFVSDVQSPRAKEIRREGGIALGPKVFADVVQPQRKGARKVIEQDYFSSQIKAVAQVLEGYGVLKGLSYEQQDELFRAIVRIFQTGGDK